MPRHKKDLDVTARCRDGGVPSGRAMFGLGDFEEEVDVLAEAFPGAAVFRRVERCRR